MDTIDKTIDTLNTWIQLDANCIGFNKESNGQLRYAFGAAIAADHRGAKAPDFIPVRFDATQTVWVKAIGATALITQFIEA